VSGNANKANAGRENQRPEHYGGGYEGACVRA